MHSNYGICVFLALCCGMFVFYVRQRRLMTTSGVIFMILGWTVELTLLWFNQWVALMVIIVARRFPARGEWWINELGRRALDEIRIPSGWNGFVYELKVIALAVVVSTLLYSLVPLVDLLSR